MTHLRKGRKSAATLSFVPKGRIAAHGAASFPCAAQGTRLRGIFSFLGKRISPFDPQEKGIRLAVSDLNDSYASGMGMPARGIAAVGVAIRFDSLLLSAVAQPLAALLPYGCGTPLAGAALESNRRFSVIAYYR